MAKKRDGRAAGPLTGLLRQAIHDSGLPMNTLAKAAGVERMSITRFVQGSSSLRLDVADKLAEALGLELKRRG
jgi:plasmid maintenance system antidote protein VapI